MKTIQREIVGAYIFSSDGKILLGYNKKGGTYQNVLVIPGGGIEKGETKIDAMKREILEETGIDVSTATITQIEGMAPSGESEKILKETGEKVLVKMNFYDFEVRMREQSGHINLRFEDDFAEADWYTPEELKDAPIGAITKATLQKIHFL